MVRIKCTGFEDLKNKIEQMYPLDGSIRHWIIETTQEPILIFVQPNVSTPLNSFYIENPSPEDVSDIESFFKGKMKLIKCSKFDPNTKRLIFGNIDDFLKAFATMYPPKTTKRHWIILTTKAPKIAYIQPNVSTGLNSFLYENKMGEKQEAKITNFADKNEIMVIRTETFDFEDRM